MAVGGDREIRTIGIVGGGIVGLSAAIAFARALPKVRVGLLDLPPDPAALADRMTGTLPAVSRFHASIGIEEADLVRSGAATHRLGTRFENWSADGDPWYHVFGAYGLSGGGVPFQHLWARARREKRALPYDRYASAAALAAAGKFVHPQDDPMSPLSTYVYALRLDPERYREQLEAHSRSLALLRASGELGSVERREDGGVAALVLKDGRRLEADLFVDCAGPSAPVRSIVGGGFEDWSESLPCDRLLLAEQAGSPAPSSCDVATAIPIGWRWSFPMRDRTMTGLAYASAVTDEAEARATTGFEAAEAVAIRPGRRTEPWAHNVIAIGDAAVALDPLHGTNLHLAQSAITRALELMPGRDCNPLELQEYNRRTADETRRVRDFLAVHYLRSGLREGPFWRETAGRKLPDSLAHTLEQFEVRGRLPFYEEESFDRESWLAVLFGLGILPHHTDAIAAAVDPEETVAALRRLSEGLAAVPDRLPPYDAYLARMTGAPGR
jgi:tryptophan halogenase